VIARSLPPPETANSDSARLDTPYTRSAVGCGISLSSLHANDSEATSIVQTLASESTIVSAAEDALPPIATRREGRADDRSRCSVWPSRMSSAFADATASHLPRAPVKARDCTSRFANDLHGVPSRPQSITTSDRRGRSDPR
jgi:hypothetical protein